MAQAGIPSRLLIHTGTLIHPGTASDAYGEHDSYAEADGAQRVTIRAWVQQDTRMRIAVDGGVPLQARWLLITDHTDVRRRDRFEWNGPNGLITFDFDGQPEPTYNALAGTSVHHTEVRMIVVDG
jgi:hypothetical protein